MLLWYIINEISQACIHPTAKADGLSASKIVIIEVVSMLLLI